jgi:F-box/leucine-rich repeat protein 2/20
MPPVVYLQARGKCESFNARSNLVNNSRIVSSKLMMVANPNAASPGGKGVEMKSVQTRSRKRLTSWFDMPPEVKIKIISYLDSRDIILSSRVSRSWHQMCYDGQLWSTLDTAEFYHGIPAEAVTMIITKAGPFMRGLNLCGVKMRDSWNIRGLPEACGNLQNLSLRGCKVDETAIHSFLSAKNRLVHIDLSGLAAATNHAMQIIAADCHELQHLDISRCNNIDTCGLRKVIEACPDLRDVRADKVRGWGNIEFMQQLFLRNSLERLVLKNCDSVTDESLAVLIEGEVSEMKSSSGGPTVPPRKLKHLDLTRCRAISDRGVRALVNNIPGVECLRLSYCHGIFEETLNQLLLTTPMLADLDLEKLDALTDGVLHTLASSPCARHLRHLSVADCEEVGDIGMVSLLRACSSLRSLAMDKTRISDLALVAAVDMVRQRTLRTVRTDRIPLQPTIGLSLRFYDCSNVTWTGIREVLSHNAETIAVTNHPQLPQPEKHSEGSSRSATAISPLSTTSNASLHFSHFAGRHTRNTHRHSWPAQIIAVSMGFDTCQQAVNEHTKRVLGLDLPAAQRLKRRWTEFLMAQDELDAGGGRGRLKRRRVRKAQMDLANELASSNGASTRVWGRLRTHRFLHE